MTKVLRSNDLRALMGQLQSYEADESWQRFTPDDADTVNAAGTELKKVQEFMQLLQGKGEGALAKFRMAAEACELTCVLQSLEGDEIQPMSPGASSSFYMRES